MYLQKIESEMGRFLTHTEKTIAMRRYNSGWHPSRTKEYIVAIAKNNGNK